MSSLLSWGEWQNSCLTQCVSLQNKTSYYIRVNNVAQTNSKQPSGSSYIIEPNGSLMGSLSEGAIEAGKFFGSLGISKSQDMSKQVTHPFSFPEQGAESRFDWQPFKDGPNLRFVNKGTSKNVWEISLTDIDSKLK